MAAPQRRLAVEIVAYCADCDADFAESEEKHLGVRFRCPNDPQHLSAVVYGREGRFWLWLESILLQYQSRWSPIHWFGHVFEYRAGLWVIGRLLLLLIALVAVAWIPRSSVCGRLLSAIPVLMALGLFFDIVAGNTSIAFTTRSPTNLLRTTVLTLISFFSVALVFAVLFSLMPSSFDPPLNPIRAIYFSLITITTVGYGDIKPCEDVWVPQLLIMVEIAVGAYFLVVLLAIVSSWANTRSVYQGIRSLEEVRAFPLPRLTGGGTHEDRSRGAGSEPHAEQSLAQKQL